jgi:hypothetical protein
MPLRTKIRTPRRRHPRSRGPRGWTPRSGDDAGAVDLAVLGGAGLEALAARDVLVELVVLGLRLLVGGCEFTGPAILLGCVDEALHVLPGGCPLVTELLDIRHALSFRDPADSPDSPLLSGRLGGQVRNAARGAHGPSRVRHHRGGGFCGGRGIRSCAARRNPRRSRWGRTHKRSRRSARAAGVRPRGPRG